MEKSLSDQDSHEPKSVFKWVKGNLIGKGTHGVVYLALDTTTGDLMAVKQVESPKTTSDQNDNRAIDDIFAEYDTLKDLNHPNIVQYLGFEQSTNYLNIFMEYVPGGSIGYCLQKYGKFSHDVVRSFAAQILAGLEYLHSRGVSHRNLTVDNILLDNSGVCKLYISNRSASGQGHDTNVDIWCLGCIVLEMWAGKRLWEQSNTMRFERTAVPPVPDDVVLNELEDDFRRKCFVIDTNEQLTIAELKRHAFLELNPDNRLDIHELPLVS